MKFVIKRQCHTHTIHFDGLACEYVLHPLFSQKGFGAMSMCGFCNKWLAAHCDLYMCVMCGYAGFFVLGMGCRWRVNGARVV